MTERGKEENKKELCKKTVPVLMFFHDVLNSVMMSKVSERAVIEHISEIANGRQKDQYSMIYHSC